MLKAMILVSCLLATAAAAEPMNLRADVPASPPQEAQVIERHFAPGETSGWHVHHGVEMTWVAKGEMTLTVAGQPVRVLHPGDSFRIERDTPHEATNTGGAEAVLIVIYVLDKGGPAKVPVDPPR